jgi:hypothetical protein
MAHQPHSSSPDSSPDDARRRSPDGQAIRRWRRCCARARLLGRAHCPACGQAMGGAASARALDAVIRRWEHEAAHSPVAPEARLVRVIRRLLRRSHALTLADLAAILGMPIGTLKALVERQIAFGVLARAGALATRPNRTRMLVRRAR